MSLANWQHSCRDGRMQRKRDRLRGRAPERDRFADIDDGELHLLMAFTDWEWEYHYDHIAQEES